MAEDWTCFLDLCLISYVLIDLTAFYGFLLFAWWLKYSHRATEVYIYIMALFLCIVFNYSLNIFARATFLVSKETYTDILRSPIWHFRPVPILVVLMLIVYRMTKRACMYVSIYKEVDLLAERSDCRHIILNAIQSLKGISIQIERQSACAGELDVKNKLAAMNRYYIIMEEMLAKCRIDIIKNGSNVK